MDGQTSELLPFVKALADADRLKIVGLLAQKPATAKQVAEQLHLPFRDAFNHLAFLEHAGVVRVRSESGVSLYELDTDGMEAISRRQLAGQPRPTYGANLDPKSRQVLRDYLSEDGSIREIPIQKPDKLRVLLDYLVEAFTPGVDYTEKEVNLIIRRFHIDVAGLRRDLVDAGLLARERDGSRYWRPEKPAAE
jgi:hypothetical protein